MKFIALKTADGCNKGEISFCCRLLKVSREGFHKYILNRNKPWKYESVATEIKKILAEDECNDEYGRERMYQALKLKNLPDINIPSERTVYRIMKQIGIRCHIKRGPKGITKADRAARKSDDLLKRDFYADKPLTKAVTDITEIKCINGKLYVSGMFDCYDLAVIGLAMDTNMKADLCVRTLENAVKRYPDLRGGIVHSDRGSQYTSELYRNVIRRYGVLQSMNSDGGRCHDNARCESMWARMKTELLYGRYKTERMTTDEVKNIVWRYFMSYWNNRRICSANEGLPPMIKRKKYYETIAVAG